MSGGEKTLIDAEDLVRWAASEELPKKRPRGSRTPPDLIRGLAPGDGELVGKWAAPPGFPVIHPMFAAAHGSGPGGRAIMFAGEPDEDALRVEAAIYEIARSPHPCPSPIKGEGYAAIAAHGIGLEVDANGALIAARRNIAGLVLVHGALRSRPDWDTPFAVIQVLAKNEKPAVFRQSFVRLPTIDGKGATISTEVHCERLRSGLYPDDSYCRLDYEPDPQSVIEWRADYLIWRAALQLLAEMLEGALMRFEPLAPAAPEAPWLKAM